MRFPTVVIRLQTGFSIECDFKRNRIREEEEISRHATVVYYTLIKSPYVFPLLLCDYFVNENHRNTNLIRTLVRT